MKYKFPDNFLWGSAISAPQTESKGIEDTKDKEETIWEYAFKNHNERFFEGNFVMNGMKENYKRDIEIAKSLNFNSLRFSIQWSRLVDRNGKVLKAGLEYYNNFINEVISKDMKPIVNLFHWDMPMWAQEKGSWASREVIDAYAKYARIAFYNFGDRVKDWLTFCEPFVIVEAAYLYDYHYPYIQDLKQAWKVQWGLVIAHKKAVKEYRESKSDGRIGSSINIEPGYPRSQSEEDIESKDIFELIQWKSFMDPFVNNEYPQELIAFAKENDFWPETLIEESDWDLIRDYGMDFVGVNYYFPTRIKAPEDPQSGELPNQKFYNNYDMPGKRVNPYRGWEVYPKGIYDALMIVKERYNNIPCYISENGIGVSDEMQFADKNGIIQDHYREDFVSEHLVWIKKAIENGSSVFGYHMWAYIDNWSWQNAYKNRYGFVSLNIETGERIEKGSAKWIREVIKNNEVDWNE